MKNCHHVFGFSLIETLVVISLLAFIADLGLADGIAQLERVTPRSDYQLVLAALREARARSMSNHCIIAPCNQPTAHGVFISPQQLTIFEGARYAARQTQTDLVIPFSMSETLSNSREIVFAAITGDVSANTSLSLTGNDHRTRSISINTEGAISP